MNLEGASAIVTGGASGIGEATARGLAALGVRCVIADLNAEKGADVAKSLDGVFVQADVVDTSQVQHAVQEASRLGPLRVLVNAAGTGAPGRTVGKDGAPADLASFERVVRINLIGAYNCLRLAAAEMATTAPLDGDGARGTIVNIASLAAFDGQVGQASYSASKSGIVGMTLPVARDLSVLGIRVNTIAPGLVDTPIYGQGDAADRFKAHLAESALFPRRLGTVHELADMVIAVATNTFMNGETIRVDGGVRLPAK